MDTDTRLEEMQTVIQGLNAELDSMRSRLLELDAQRTDAMRTATRSASLYVALDRLHAGLDRSAVLDAIEEILKDLLGTEMAAIFVVDPAKERLVPLKTFGTNMGPVEPLDYDEGPIGKAAATGERIISEGDEILVAAPLLVAGQVIGVLAVYELVPHKDHLEALDLELIDLLTGHAAIALKAASTNQP